MMIGKGCSKTMNNVWTEDAIRAELAKLDAKTGLTGAKLPISFSNAKCTLGQYCSNGGGSFRFSNHYYQDPTWPLEEALDTIRHEYAHYMDHVLYGNLGHGVTWKHCCTIVGALPIHCYNEKRAEYYQHKHAEEAKLAKHYDTYIVGSKIVHPHFGVGVIMEITGESISRCITVDFDGVGCKRLGLTWVDKNCRKCS